MDVSEPTWQELKEVVEKARSGSAPGPNGIPYIVYKRCPMLLRELWQLFCVIWRKGIIPECWKEAEGCFAPKEKNSMTINQFRTISLLNLEVKMFVSVGKKNFWVYGGEQLHRYRRQEYEGSPDA